MAAEDRFASIRTDAMETRSKQAFPKAKSKRVFGQTLRISENAVNFPSACARGQS
jgi:hypothetical protein